MIHIAVWRTMTAVTVEIRCNHAQGQTGGSHLIHREMQDPGEDTAHATLAVAADVVDWVARNAHQGEVPGLTDECGWA